jgi:hypothetical protein
MREVTEEEIAGIRDYLGSHGIEIDGHVHLDGEAGGLTVFQVGEKRREGEPLRDNRIFVVVGGGPIRHYPRDWDKHLDFKYHALLCLCLGEYHLGRLAQEQWKGPVRTPTDATVEELDAFPLGTATEERKRAKDWCRCAVEYAKREIHWRGVAEFFWRGLYFVDFLVVRFAKRLPPAEKDRDFRPELREIHSIASSRTDKIAVDPDNLGRESVVVKSPEDLPVLPPGFTWHWSC